MVDNEILIDLCARVPYHPKGRVVNNRTGAACEEWLTCATFQMFTSATNNCRLYLRPLSSMTEKENESLMASTNYLLRYDEVSDYIKGAEEVDGYCVDAGLWAWNKAFDWLNRNHFDYRGLIPNGMALEAPVDMYCVK